jgi:hypothetical protein
MQWFLVAIYLGVGLAVVLAPFNDNDDDKN